MTRRAANKVVILDRDGTMVIDRHYLSDPKGLEFLPGAAEGLRSMCAQGYRLIVITNQSGVGRGLFTLGRLQEMNDRLRDMVNAGGARLDGIYYCLHRPDEQCDCRKPHQKLLQQASVELGFDPARSVVIGDKASDVEFGRLAGARTILVADPAGVPASTAADHVVRDLNQAADVLRSLE